MAVNFRGVECLCWARGGTRGKPHSRVALRLRGPVWPGSGPQPEQPACLFYPPPPQDKAGSQPDTPHSLLITPPFCSLSSGSPCPLFLCTSLFSHIFHSCFLHRLTKLIRNPHTDVPLHFPIYAHITRLHASTSHTPHPPLWCTCLPSCHCVWAPHQTAA